jgi:hypothetical protein
MFCQLPANTLHRYERRIKGRKYAAGRRFPAAGGAFLLYKGKNRFTQSVKLYNIGKLNRLTGFIRAILRQASG